MSMKRRVLLIGVGLIGGSVALAIKKEHEDAHIAGYDVNHESARLAKKMNMIDEVVQELAVEATKADLIMLACPVKQVEKFITVLAELPLKKHVIISDVGSTKSDIMKKSTVLYEKGFTFIGGHPMAGSHKSGAGSARAHLFENAFYILTPLEETENERLNELKEWLKGTKAKFITMDATEHDHITGIVSHFPHLIAASLVRQVKNHAMKDERVTWLAAGGFRDITRIASSSPEMWSDIFKQNQHTLLDLIDEWKAEMEVVKELVRSGNYHSLYEYFSGAKKFRDSLPVKARGAIEAFYDLYVDVLDKPGVISHVTTILAKEQISITNIRIIESRQDVFGVLRLSFQSENDREKGRKCLENNGFETFISM